jgi:hypothetical protein
MRAIINELPSPNEMTLHQPLVEITSPLSKTYLKNNLSGFDNVMSRSRIQLAGSTSYETNSKLDMVSNRCR